MYLQDIRIFGGNLNEIASRRLKGGVLLRWKGEQKNIRRKGVYRKYTEGQNRSRRRREKRPGRRMEREMFVTEIYSCGTRRIGSAPFFSFFFIIIFFS